MAAEAGVRLALHPNDPPVPLSRGSGQIMATLAGWKRLVDIVKSPSNGITFDCGVTREMGEDPVTVARYFGARDCINHVHFRNVIRAQALREVHRRLHRRRPGGYVRGDEGARAPALPSRRLSRTPARYRRRPRTRQPSDSNPNFKRRRPNLQALRVRNHAGGRKVSNIETNIRLLLAEHAASRPHTLRSRDREGAILTTGCRFSWCWRLRLSCPLWPRRLHARRTMTSQRPSAFALSLQ
ncbi:MAG: mannonate dehydratase [Bryobacteraceae bacterium]